MALSPAQQNLARIVALPENRLCVDCSSRAPTWASFNLGYFVCIDCSGIHRQIGTHITKVRWGACGGLPTTDALPCACSHQ